MSKIKKGTTTELLIIRRNKEFIERKIKKDRKKERKKERIKQGKTRKNL